MRRRRAVPARRLSPSLRGQQSGRLRRTLRPGPERRVMLAEAGWWLVEDRLQLSGESLQGAFVDGHLSQGYLIQCLAKRFIELIAAIVPGREVGLGLEYRLALLFADAGRVAFTVEQAGIAVDIGARAGCAG